MSDIGSSSGTPARRAGFGRRRLTRPRLLQIGIIVMAAVVVALLVLIGLGVLVLPAANPPNVTVTAVSWHIDQGTNPDGTGWFGPSWVNETDTSGLPFQVASGHTFVEALTLVVSTNHTLYSASVQGPFSMTACQPTLPTTPIGVDDFIFHATIVAPTVSSGTSYSLYLTLNALTPAAVPCGG